MITLTKLTLTNVQNQIKAAESLSRPFNINNSLRQGDALENVIRDADINTRGAIIFKSPQLLAYVDYAPIMKRTTGDVQTACIQIEQAARDLGLHIQRGKTKYMVAALAPKTNQPITSNRPGQTRLITLGDYKFVTADNSSYLRSKITTDNSYDDGIRA